MKSRYLLSSFGIHLALAALLTPLVLQTPREYRRQEAFVELQKASDPTYDIAKKNRLKRIVVTAEKMAETPKARLNTSTDSET